MLNLEALERKLDEALAKENSQSLTEWLLNHRKDNISNFLGIGCIKNLKAPSFSNTQTSVYTHSNCTDRQKGSTTNNDYRQAA